MEESSAHPISLEGTHYRLPEYFTQLFFSYLPRVGHFVPFEAPDEVLKAIQKTLV